MDYGITDILTLLGALGLFLYGMKVMSDALMEVAGDKMRNILAKMTSNRVFAVFTGFLITAIIQSSSATTLMVVSFANASLLTLAESIGVIMGANIGTTVTAWLITILGFKVSMSAIALPLVGLGFLMTFTKNKTRKNWGLFIIGFAVLFIGLQFLKDSVPDIGQNPDALAFLSKYTNLGFISVLIFLLIGTILTVVIQSSSATMALTLVMCFEGWIPFDMAAAMVLGENIGTTITANIAAFVSNFHAKRTARAHFIFNIIGVVWILVLFFPFLKGIDFLVTRNGGASPFVTAAAIPVALSMFHTVFNIINTIMLLAFVPLIAKIVIKMVPEKVDDLHRIDQPKYLKESYLQYPQTGISALMKESMRLFENTAFGAIAHGINVHKSDILSDKKLGEIVDNTEVIEIDFHDLYYNRIKTIYSKIVEFATTLQSKFELNKNKIENIRNILVANRYQVAAIKAMEPVHKNMSKYIKSDNYHIKKEYNNLRKILIKVFREIEELRLAGNPKKSFKRLIKLQGKSEKRDVLLDGSIEKLLRKDLITNEMATSLMNDSNSVQQIVSDLINVSQLLYMHTDLIVEDGYLETKVDTDALLAPA